MMKNKQMKQKIFILVLFWTTCTATLSQFAPANDDFGERLDNYGPEYYYNVKRSYIYPEDEVERYSDVSEVENDDRRDLVKGPSIEPIIDGTEEMAVDKEYAEQQSMNPKSFYEMKAGKEKTENGEKLSKIAGKKMARPSSRNPKHKISAKEKEEISEGLIKLLYDWKTQKNQDDSESGEGETKERAEEKEAGAEDKEEGAEIKAKEIKGKSFEDEEKVDEVKNSIKGKSFEDSNNSEEGKNLEEGKDLLEETTKRVGSGKEASSDEDDDIDTRNENAQAAIDSALHDPEVRSKAAGNEVSLGNDEDDKDEKATKGLDDGEESGEGKESRSKTRGKINVMVNVNINERSLRSKVSHAKKRMHKILTELEEDKDSKEKEQEIAKELNDDNNNYDEEENSGSGVEEDDEENENEEPIKNVSQTNNTPMSTQYANTNQNYSQTPAYATNYQFPAQAPQFPVAMPAQQLSYQAPQLQYQQQYINNNNNNNNAQAPYMALTYQSSPNVTAAAAVTEGEQENSGDDEEFENETGSAGRESGSGEMQPQNNQPAKTQTVQSKQRTAQIFFPGAMQTITETHKSKQEKEQKSGEEDTLEEEEEHASKEDEEEAEEMDQNTASQITEYKPMKGPITKAKSGRSKKHKHKMFTNAESERESLGAVKVAETNSEAIKNVKKQRKNPNKVTKTADKVGKANRPAEATKSKSEPSNKEARLKNFEPESRQANSQFLKLHDFDNKEDKVHLVKLHDSELRLLREEKAKLLASEPIVIDDIKKKHEKPKPIPKEATNINKTSTMSKMSLFAKHQENNSGKVENLKNEDLNVKKMDKNQEEALKKIEKTEEADSKKIEKVQEEGSKKIQKTQEDELKKTENFKQVEIKPTTKRSYLTTTKESSKPEVVAPPAKETNIHTEAPEAKEKTEENAAGSGESLTKKYGSLKSVRERFKDWEKEMIAKLSNPYLKSGSEGEGEGSEGKEAAGNQTTAFNSWEDEEKDLINRLANPYLHQEPKVKKFVPKIETKEKQVDAKISDKENATKAQNVEKQSVTKEQNKEKETATKEQNKENENASEAQNKEKENAKGQDKEKENATKAQNKESTSSFQNVLGKATPIKQDNHTKDLKNKEELSSAKPLQKVQELQSEMPVSTGKENKAIEKADDLKSLESKESDKVEEILKASDDKSKFKELEKFKKQIMVEVDKINKLQNEYKSNLMKSNELDKAKETLNKDLSSIKNIEKNLTEELKKKQEKKVDQKSKSLKMGMIPIPSKKKGDKKDDPLVKIQGLLKAEMLRTKKKKKNGHDKQLDNIRGMLKNELSRLIKSGKLGSPNDLPAGLRKLGKMIHKKLKNAKKKGKNNKKKNKEKKNKSGDKIFGNELKNSLDLMKQYKPTVPGTGKSMITTINSYKAAMKKLEDLREQQRLAGSDINNADNSYKPQANTNATTKSPVNPPAQTPTKPHVVMPQKLPTGAQTEQFKNLLQNLNKKIGEVYTRLQTNGNNPNKGNNQQQNNGQNNNGQSGNNGQSNYNNGQNNNNGLNNNGQNNNNNGQNNNNQQNNALQMANNGLGNNAFANNNIPGNNGFGNNNGFASNYAQPNSMPQPMNYAPPASQPAMIEGNNYNALQAKHETPEPDTDDIDEPETDTVEAETEPVENLIESLEKDITEVWSYKDIYPDAGSLGLDNDKIHQTYANLGSMSGLSLRRALDRALRGKDVGLAIVGGSISKGGPFSEKGVEFAVKAYFYAIADWWNKVIRPITGSSMIIRDVSIGGIATDYYSYCLRTHLPNDKLTNIVLWELAANDMRRYDDMIKPKPQSLEQFTQNVLSYKAKPALIFLNFFALFAWDKDLLSHCRNFEDEGENEIAKHYKITSLSWRDMVCNSMQQNAPLFTRDELFAEDQFHPSIEAHAQMAYVVIDYIRTEFLKNLVKQRFLEIGDAARRLKIPETVYVPKPIYKDTFTWKPVCYTYMMVDNQQPNNTLNLAQETTGDYRYTVLREYKIRSDKIIGMETKSSDQYLTYTIHVPAHPKGDTRPFKKLAIMSFTDDRQAEVRFDNLPVKKIDTAKKFLEGTILNYVADNVPPGEHKLVIKSGPGGFFVSAVMLG